MGTTDVSNDHTAESVEDELAMAVDESVDGETEPTETAAQIDPIDEEGSDEESIDAVGSDEELGDQEPGDVAVAEPVGEGDGTHSPDESERPADTAGFDQVPAERPVRLHPAIAAAPKATRRSAVGRAVRFARPTLGWRRTALSVVSLGIVVGALTWAVNVGMADPNAAKSTAVAAETITTTQPTTTVAPTTQAPATTAPVRPIDLEEAGQGCTQIANKDYSYADALSYYVRTGEPERMDPDHDDIPCESNYSAEEKSGVWLAIKAAGQPIPATALN